MVFLPHISSPGPAGTRYGVFEYVYAFFPPKRGGYDTG